MTSFPNYLYRFISPTRADKYSKTKEIDALNEIFFHRIEKEYSLYSQEKLENEKEPIDTRITYMIAYITTYSSLKIKENSGIIELKTQDIIDINNIDEPILKIVNLIHPHYGIEFIEDNIENKLQFLLYIHELISFYHPCSKYMAFTNL